MIQILLQDPVRQTDVEVLGDLLGQGARPARRGRRSRSASAASRGAVAVDARAGRLARPPVRDARGVLAFLPRDPARVRRRRPAPWSEALTGHLALVLDNARLSQRLHELSTLDGLTRQLNHRVIYDRLTEELERARRYKYPLSVVLCDFDHFKEVNDTHGHLAGDAVLREGAAVLRTLPAQHRPARALRRRGVPGRAAAGRPRGRARMAAERLRVGLEKDPVRLAGGVEVRITASFGVADRDELAGAAEQRPAGVARRPPPLRGQGRRPQPRPPMSRFP